MNAIIFYMLYFMHIVSLTTTITQRVRTTLMILYVKKLSSGRVISHSRTMAGPGFELNPLCL